MRQIVMGREVDKILGPWICARAGGTYSIGSTIGVVENGEILGAVLYENYTGTNISMHVASNGTKRWMNPFSLWVFFDYPFVQLGCKRVTGIVPSTNLAARKFDENLGFALEATLKDACPDGDLLIYSMFRDQCKWLKLRSRYVDATTGAISPVPAGRPKAGGIRQSSDSPDDSWRGSAGWDGNAGQPTRH